MTLIRGLLWCSMLIALFFLITCFSLRVEGFEVSLTSQVEQLQKDEESLNTNIDSGLTLASEVLCPAIDLVKGQFADDMKTEDEKNMVESDLSEERKGALKQGADLQLRLLTAGIQPTPLAMAMSANTPGFVFPCPIPKDKKKLPADIHTYILTTSSVCVTKLVIIKQQILDALSNNCSSKKTKKEKEGFEDISTSIPTTTPKTESVGQDLELQQKISVQKQRLLALQIQNEQLQKAIASELFQKTKALSEEIRSIKQQAESGNMTPNC